MPGIYMKMNIESEMRVWDMEQYVRSWVYAAKDDTTLIGKGDVMRPLP